MGMRRGRFRAGGGPPVRARRQHFALRADTTTSAGSSILIFPKVMVLSRDYDPQGLDTVIQISNTSNSMVYAHCVYVNGAPLDPRFPPSAQNPPQCQEVDFTIFLTKQQPTHWVVSTGRRVEPSATCTSTSRRVTVPASIPAPFRRWGTISRRIALRRGGLVRCADQRQSLERRGYPRDP